MSTSTPQNRAFCSIKTQNGESPIVQCRFSKQNKQKEEFLLYTWNAFALIWGHSEMALGKKETGITSVAF